MPRVPVIDSPSASPSPLPVVQAPLPSAETFGSQVGASVEDLGTAIHRDIANPERALAIRDMARDAETRVMRAQMEVRKTYTQKMGADARDSWPQFEKQLYEVRDSAGRELEKRSRTARDQMDANAMRNERIELGVMETHFNTQTRVARLQSYKARGMVVANDLSTLSMSDHSELGQQTVMAAAAEKIAAYKKIVDQEAEDRGVPPEVREDFARQEMRAPLTSLINALTDNHHPALAEAMKTWGGIMSGGEQKRTYKVMNEMEIDNRAANITRALPHIDADRDPDEHGFVPYEAVQAAVAAIPRDDPEQAAKIEKRVWENYDKENARFQHAGAQLEMIVVRQGQGRGAGGSWAAPEDSRDWQDFKRLYPTRAANISGKADKIAQADLKHTTANARGSALDDFERMDPDVQKYQKYEQIASMVRAYEPRATGEDIDKVWKRVQDIQQGNGDTTSKRMSEIVKKGLKGAFGRDEQMATRFGGMARDFAEDLHREDPKLKEEEIVARVSKEAQNWVPGIFSKGKPYVRPQKTTPPPAARPTQPAPMAKPAADTGSADDEWTFTVDGTPIPPKGKK